MKPLRVNAFGLIEVLVDAELVWGMHNSICWRRPIKKGHFFNSLNVVGSWHDLLPKVYRRNGRYFRRIGDSIPWVEIERHNRSRGPL